MIFAKIWERMIFFRALRFILFFLVSIYFVYVIIDLSAHSGRLFSSATSIPSILLYYVHNLLAHFDLFLPLSMLLTTISLLTSMNLHREIVALRMGGISLKKLSRPLFLISFLLTICCYANYEYTSPFSLSFIENFKEKNLHHRGKESVDMQIASLVDGSKVIFHTFDPQKKELFDLFWIRSHSDLWHIKSLSLQTQEGKFADHLVRRKNDNKFEKKESYDRHIFSEIPLSSLTNGNFFIPKEELPLSSLLGQKIFLTKAERAATFSHLSYKLVLPLLSPLILLSLVPFCVGFNRNLRIFFVTALALFSFFTFITMMDSCVILGENQVVSPFFALTLPLLFFYLFFGWRFLTTNK